MSVGARALRKQTSTFVMVSVVGQASETLPTIPSPASTQETGAGCAAGLLASWAGRQRAGIWWLGGHLDSISRTLRSMGTGRSGVHCLSHLVVLLTRGRGERMKMTLERKETWKGKDSYYVFLPFIRFQIFWKRKKMGGI